MTRSSYTLKKMGETDECHLFKGRFTNKGCTGSLFVRRWIKLIVLKIYLHARMTELLA